jgi:hypothetical protein
MVVNYFDDPNCADGGLVGGIRVGFASPVVDRLEDEAPGAPKVEGVLAGAVRPKGVQSSRGAPSIGESGSSFEHGESPAQDSPLLSPETANTVPIGRAVPAELPVRP